jgi:hypothetical protein
MFIYLARILLFLGGKYQGCHTERQKNRYERLSLFTAVKSQKVK